MLRCYTGGVGRTIPESPQAVPAREAGRLTADLNFSLCSSKYDPAVSLSALQQTLCSGLSLLSVPIARTLRSSWWNTMFFVSPMDPLTTYPTLAHPHSYVISQYPETHFT